MPRPLTIIGLIFLVTLFFYAQADDFDACASMFPGGVTPTQHADAVVDVCKSADDRPIFAIRFDTARHIPAWTAHSLSPAQIRAGDANAGKLKRPSFKPGPNVPKDRQAKDSSYTNSGYQRGHMVPADDMSWSKAAYDTTFILTNAVPQLAKLNNGTWRGLEDDFRAMVLARGEALWVFAGTYGSIGTIGQAPNTAEIPRCFYKIIVSPNGDTQTYKVLATVFAFDDQRPRRAWRDSLTTLERIEARTGIDFLAGLEVEAQHDANYWGVAMPATPADCQ